MLTWLMENWVALLEGVMLTLSGLSVIAGLTPTPRDDAVISKIIATLSFLTPKDSPGTLKVPFTKP